MPNITTNHAITYTSTASALVSSAGHFAGDNVFKIQFYLFRGFSPFYLDKAVIFFVFFPLVGSGILRNSS